MLGWSVADRVSTRYGAKLISGQTANLALLAQHSVLLLYHTKTNAHLGFLTYPSPQPHHPNDILRLLVPNLALFLAHYSYFSSHSNSLVRTAVREEGDEGRIHAWTRMEDG